MHYPTALILAWAALTGPALASTSDHHRRLPRAVTALNQAAFDESHTRDNSAVRAFSNVEIVSADGRCLFVDPLSGDFRANLNPVQLAACGSTAGQGWDVLTSGLHNNLPAVALFVNTLTQACLNFDPRRRAGNQVLMFSCGGRADGSGHVTKSQLFAFADIVAPGRFNLTPQNELGSCLTAANANANALLDITPCLASATGILFSIGGSAGSGPVSPSGPPANGTPSPTAGSVLATTFSTQLVAAPPSPLALDPVTVAPFITSSAIDPQTQVTPPPTAAAAPATNAVGLSGAPSDPGFINFDPTVPTPVSGAGGMLRPSAAAEAQQVHNTDTRAFESVDIVAPNKQCLAVNPVAGDFRQNLIPIQLVDCTGAPNEKWDLITAGVHNDQKGKTLLVSSLTNGCITFDDRRASGNKVTVFSCGGRGDGSGQVDAAQLFPFNGQTSLSLSPSNSNGATCLVPDNGVIDVAACAADNAASQTFQIVTLA